MLSNTDSDILIPQFDNEQKLNFKKYLPISEVDREWGFMVNDAGRTVIARNTEYPPRGHPGTHMFSWETGRILNEYHFVLITGGKGIFESRSAGLRHIGTGDAIMLFPGEWHRYKPVKKTGWTENWVGFSGPVADIVMKDVFFKREEPVVQKSANMLVVNLFKSLFQLVTEEPYGFQRMASGICLQIIAEFCNIQKGSETAGTVQSLISKAKYIMHQKIDGDIDFSAFSRNHGVSYSKFRGDFKRQTGFAPLQYFLLLKIEKAKDLLKNTTFSSKEIAFRIGFQSAHYFCRVFKQKTGLTPQQFRMKGWAG